MESLDMVALFGELLNTDDILAEDNFFDVGGNSILALTLLEEIEKRWDVALELIDVIRAPTAGEVAKLVRQAQAAGHAPADEIAPGTAGADS